MHKEIRRCRLCGNNNLKDVIDLGNFRLTGVFPKSVTDPVTEAPLRLVRCEGTSPDACGLLQLKHTVEPSLLYGESYGYRSNLNATITGYLKSTYEYISGMAGLKSGDVVIDIGSSDGSFLNFFPKGLALIGVDPLMRKFARYYDDHITLLDGYFHPELVLPLLNGRKAKVVSSISMFYDIDAPLDFAGQVRGLLDREGLWVIELSYLPLMLKNTAYDNICHEHLGYYGLRQFCWLAEKAGLKIIDASTSALNGGSFRIVLCREDAKYETQDSVRIMRDSENAFLNSHRVFRDFAERVKEHRSELTGLLKNYKAQNKTIVGFGASTKGNVLLQYCGIGPELLDYIVEINEEKCGSFTPGSNIPIVPQERLITDKPDYVLVLPWHLRAFANERQGSLFDKSTSPIFPLPSIT